MFAYRLPQRPPPVAAREGVVRVLDEMHAHLSRTAQRTGLSTGVELEQTIPWVRAREEERQVPAGLSDALQVARQVFLLRMRREDSHRGIGSRARCLPGAH